MPSGDPEEFETNETPDSNPDDESSQQIAETFSDQAEKSFESISLLISPTKAGDADARAEMMRFLQEVVENQANRQHDRSLRHKAGASDIVQQSFVQIIENFDKFRGKSEGELRAWVKTIVANEMNRIRRQFRTAKRDYTQETAIEPKSSTAPGLVPTDRHMTPSSEAIQAERKQIFNEILDQLSPEHAEVIRLRSLDRLPFEEIGKRMGRSENAASKLWVRAMMGFEEKLRNQTAFKEEDDDE
ncbi:MAG: sigma-70 family RNA polymerase sigma factor [Planctomycetota bacterium]